MKIFNAIAIAAVIGSSFLIPNPAEAFWGNGKPAYSKFESINLNEAISDRKDNPLRFRSKYKQKKIRLSGTVKFINYSSISLLATKNNNRGGTTTINCNLANGAKKEAASVNKGQYLSVYGTMGDVSGKIPNTLKDFEVDVYDCWVK